MTQLRTELLAGRMIALGGPVSGEIAETLAALGAHTEAVGEPLAGEEENVGGWARDRGPLRALVYDARPTFGSGGQVGLTATIHNAWLAVREVAVGALIVSPDPGKVVLIAPRSDAGQHAQATVAALENLARTLSVEWARYEVTTVVLAPGPRTTEAELAEVTAFLCSVAGEYLSGCRLDLGLLAGDR